MRIITREIDIAPGGVPAYISLNQYDSLFRLSLTPYCSDGSVTLATDGTGAVCTIRGTKTDGTIYSHSAAFDGTTVTVYGDVQITAVAGRQVFEIVFWNSDQSKELATANIIISVERAAADIDSVASDSVVRELYDIDQGYYDPCFGSIELPRPRGEAQVLVISSSGRGIPVYRALQKENIPFCAGILYTNDLDYRLARLLAAEVIEEKPFAEISDTVFKHAMEKLHSCKTVIDAGVEFGTCNQKMKVLLEEAEKQGKLQRGYWH